MSDKAQEIGIDGLAKAFHRSDKQIRNLLRDGVLPAPVRHSGRRPLYDYWACHHAYIEYLDGQGRQSNITKKQEEHLEKKNRRLDREHQEAMGKLVDAEAYDRIHQQHITVAKSRIRSIPSKCAEEIGYLKAAGMAQRELRVEVQKILMKEVDEILEGLSKWKP